MRASQVGLVAKNLSANAGDKRRGFDPLKEDGGGEQISQDGHGQALSPHGLLLLPHVL